ncbi:hypothetical protein AALP_AA8G186400 [Arabis alpina]|uniref:Ubiquitin-like protease family profile domain-containing protein n=1 Tax=Arabis alpina TaxID=50452 RepID=A0A087G7W5_ARAAL|nr:hypothetical protein AALP_AA8G186400 [Arabis alpina]
MKFEVLNFGPVVINDVLIRIGRYKRCLTKKDMDVVMDLFREKTSLGRLKLDRVGFMNSVFGMQLQDEYLQYLKNKDNHVWDRLILAYANGELPAQGKTSKKWGSDFVKIYFPLLVDNTHWISVCVNFVLRTVEVFDCCGRNYEKEVEAFAVTIPQIMKEIHTEAYGENLQLTPYSIIHVPVSCGLNRSKSDCGVYAIKYIECHFLNLPLDLLNDGNIRQARQKIAIDLWKAASNPAFFI